MQVIVDQATSETTPIATHFYHLQMKAIRLLSLDFSCSISTAHAAKPTIIHRKVKKTLCEKHKSHLLFNLPLRRQLNPPSGLCCWVAVHTGTAVAKQKHARPDEMQARLRHLEACASFPRLYSILLNALVEEKTLSSF